MFIPLKLGNLTQSFTNRAFWTLWVLVLIIVLGVHLTTLTISPTVWLDEVNIVELGRIILNPETDWSTMWTGKPVYVFTYLGPALQEIAFRISHESLIGPRLSSLFGGLAAATLILCYLRTRHVSRFMAFSLASLFLLEPIFVQSYRGARVDSWVMAFCIGTCLLLRLSSNRLKRGDKLPSWWVVVAGSCAAVTPFIWLSSFLLFPLILLEFIILIQIAQTVQKRRTYTARLVGITFLGWAITTVFLVLPIWPHLANSLSGFRELANANGTLRDRNNLFAELHKVMSGVISTYKVSPFIPLLFVVGLICSRNRKLVFVCLFILFLILSSYVYQFRCLYLLPYVLCLVGDVYNSSARVPKLKGRKLVSFVLFLTLIWCLMFSLILRPVNALMQAHGRNPDILHEAGMSLLGSGSHKVYLSEPELYYVGRSLGWEMYNFINLDFNQYSSGIASSTKTPLKEGEIQKFPQIDYVLTSHKTLRHPSCPATVCNLIAKLGLQEGAVFQKTTSQKLGRDPKNSVNDIGAQPYQLFVVYKSRLD